METNLKADGWSYLGSATDLIAIYRRALAPPSSKRAWIRYEHTAPTKDGVRSRVMLYDVDCSQYRVRQLQSSTYSRNNMQGEGQREGEVASWEYGAPGTFLEAFAQAICSDES